MVRKCKGDSECKTIPTFNFRNEKSPKFCKKHKKEDMVNVTTKRCAEETCDKFPMYNIPNSKLGMFCVKHKNEDMIDVLNNHCGKCNRRANFNFPSETKGIYCSEHKVENMIDIKHQKCKEANCNNIPHFNYENEKKGLYCSKHKKANMQDVTHKRCKQNGCKSLNPTFNFKNEKVGIYCVNHKQQDMVDVLNVKCNFENCLKQPNFNYFGEVTGRYCIEYKKEEMIDIKHQKNQCKIENCNTRANIKYRGHCLRCFIHLFPDEKISKNYKVREQHFVDYLKENYKELFTFDKRISGGCSKKRPDAYIDLFTHVIVLENDENQHKNYEQVCENKRMMEIFEDFANRPIVFIRFNPDAYIDEHGNKHPSSFKYHKTLDVPVIRDKNEWGNRLSVLKEIIDKWLLVIPEKEITTEYLFYDIQ